MVNRNFSCPGIILRSRASGEKNRLLDILTPGRGIIRATAYGAASPKSKLRSAAQTFHAGEMFLYEDPVKHYVKVSDFDVQFDFPGIRTDPQKLYAASLLSELYLFSDGASQDDPDSYRLMFEFLTNMGLCENRQVLTLTSLAVWRFLAILGIQPDLELDVMDASALGRGMALRYRFEEGGFTRLPERGEQMVLTPDEYDFLIGQGKRTMDRCLNFRFSRGPAHLFSLMTRIAEYHFQRRFKSLDAGLLG